MEYTLENNDVIKFLEKNDQKYHFSLFDPPYEISHIGGWDNTGITFSKELWDALYNVMLPGAYVLAYIYPGLPLAQMTLAAYNSGFDVHRTLFGWAYTSGFPFGHVKAQKGMDKYYGNQFGYCECDEPDIVMSEAVIREDNIGVGYESPWCRKCGKYVQEILEEIQWSSSTGMSKIGGPGFGANNVQTITRPVFYETYSLTDYVWGRAWVKPAIEPICVFQKPFDGDYREGVMEHGTGIVNVMGKRINDKWPTNLHLISDEFVENGNLSEYFPTVTLDNANPIALIKKPNKKERSAGMDEKNMHSSIKPINANHYFSSLFMPPEALVKYPMALSVFSGVGSEVIGMMNAGWNVDGVELDEKFCEWNYDRVSYYHPDATIFATIGL